MIIKDYYTNGDKNLILKYIEELPIKQKVYAYRIRNKIEEDGLDAFDILDTRQIRGKLYEIRFYDQRIMYLIRDSDVVYFLHICKKQKNKALQRDLRIAIRRAKELGYKIWGD